MKEAEEMYLRALAGMEKTWGSEYKQYFDIRYNLAVMHREQSMFEDAVKHFEHVVQGYTKILSSEHIETFDATNQLAITFHDQGRLDAAASTQQEVLEKMRHILGEEHPDTISAMNNLANIFSNQGRLDETISIMQETLEKLHTVFGRNDPNTTLTMRKLTVLLDSKCRQELAGLTPQTPARWQVHGSLDQAGSLHSCDYEGHQYGILGTIRDEVVDEVQQIQDLDSRFLEFHLVWDIPSFRSQECSDSQQLGSVLVLTGDGLNVQAVTCASYVHDHWPYIGQPLIDTIDQLLSSDKGYIDGKYQIV